MFAELSLAGSIVEAQADKKIVVFNGHHGGHVPSNIGAADLMLAQSMPTYFSGQHFAVVGSKNHCHDRVSVMALYNQTIVKKNGSVVANLNAGQMYEITALNPNNASYYLETTKPSEVHQYIHGGLINDELRYGDPAMTWVSPLEHFTNKAVFKILPSAISHDHYVNVITSTQGVSTMLLNQQNIADSFTVLSGNSNYQYAQIKLTDTVNILQNDSGFLAYAYGMGDTEAHLYNIAFEMTDDFAQIAINDVPYINIPPDRQWCISDTLKFSVIVDYEYNNIVWNFGDNTSGTGSECLHHFAAIGDYSISMIVERTYPNYNNELFDTVYAMVHVAESSDSFFSATICEGESYNENGFHINQPSAGTLYDTLIVEGPICDTMKLLTLTVVADAFELVGNETVCSGNVYTYTVEDAQWINVFWWNVPAGVVIQSGQNTATITVVFSETFVEGSIELHGSSRCDTIILNMPVQMINLNAHQISGGSFCEGEGGITLNTSFSNIIYTIYRDGNMVETWNGNGTGHFFGPYSESGMYRVFARLSDECEGFVGEPVQLKIVPKPPERIIFSN